MKNSVWMYSDRMERKAIEKARADRMEKAMEISRKHKGPAAVMEAFKAGTLEIDKSLYYGDGVHFTEI